MNGLPGNLGLKQQVWEQPPGAALKVNHQKSQHKIDSLM